MNINRKKMYTVVKKTAVCLAVLVILTAAAAVIMFRNEIRTLGSLEKIDDYGMFRMTYYGDYGFDDFLKTGAKNDTDIERFVTGRLLKGLPVHIHAAGAGCTAFVVHNERGEILYGRNFDFAYAPSLQVFTTPADGYASVSTVNLSFAGYGKGSLPEKMNPDSFLTLAAPYLPFDGMNEKGVAIALLAVPEADAPHSPDKVTLNTTTMIRLVLDKAATVDEAVALMKKYTIYFSGGITCHYLIADASGRSALVEYYGGAVRTVKTDEGYQIASNFIAYNGVNIGEGFTEFDRYNAVKDEITRNNNQLTNLRAIALLRDIGIYDGNTDKLQWSVLYNLTTGQTALFAHRNIDNIVWSSLRMEQRHRR
jgi:hypothetical protein